MSSIAVALNVLRAILKWIGRNWIPLLIGLAVVLAVRYVLDLKGQVHAAEKSRDTAVTELAKHVAADEKAARLVADAQARNVATLQGESAAALAEQRRQSAAALADANSRLARMAAAIARDPKSDTPVGPVLGSIFED